jgi:predicted transposase YbfD/YdcC
MPPTTIAEHFAHLEAPRCPYLTEHRLLDVVTLALCAILAGADTWVEVAAFGRQRESWLRTFLALPHGIPAHDTLGRVFAGLDPVQFAAGFASWGQALHLVSGWACEARLVLAQQAVADHSNESPALPVLLAQLDLAGGSVTVDAMGCQREVATPIAEHQTDYVLALKANQEETSEAVVDRFTLAEADRFVGMQHDQAQSVEKGHGWLEWRRCTVMDDPAILAWLNADGRWTGLRAIGRVEARRQVGAELGTIETRYYLLSQPWPAATFGHAVRAHWHIENGQHWILDSAFREDESRGRSGHAPHNLALLRRLALNLLRQDRQGIGGTKAKRLQAAWNPEYLLHLLGER